MAERKREIALGQPVLTALRDFIALMALTFLVVLILLLFYINPPDESEGAPPPGQLMVEIHWPEGDVDVDLWLQAPNNGEPTGYSNRRGRIWNLLRDDLGNTRDTLPLNYENAYSRGVPDGRYTVNVHLYANKQTVPPIPVKVRVSISVQGDVRELLTSEVELTHRGHEKTVASFVMQGRELVDVDYIQRELRD